MRRFWWFVVVAATFGLLAAVIHAQPVQTPRTLTAEMRAALEQVYVRALPAAVRIETIPEAPAPAFLLAPMGWS